MKSLFSTSCGLNLYVIYTYPNLEKKVHNLLCLRNITSFLPLQKVTRIWSDRKKNLEIPLFPNYIFVYTRTKERFEVIDLPGVVRFVSVGSCPVVVSEEEINTIKKLMVRRDVLIEQNLEEGDSVRIIEGPFIGLNGLLFERKGKTRLGIKIEAIKQVISIEVCASSVKKNEEKVFSSI